MDFAIHGGAEIDAKKQRVKLWMSREFCTTLYIDFVIRAETFRVPVSRCTRWFKYNRD